MALVLDTVQDYVDQARQLLQDLVLPYRYSDDTLIDALNTGFAEIVRLRPDLMFKLMRTQSYPFYTSLTSSVALDYRYRQAMLLYIIAMAQLADQEDTSDAHVAALLQAFTAKLMTLQA